MLRRNTIKWISSLCAIAIIAMTVGCTSRLRPLPESATPTPMPTQTPAPTRVPAATTTSSPSAGAPSATELLAAAALTRTLGDLMPTQPFTASQFIVNYPQEGLFKQETGAPDLAAGDEQNPFVVLFPKLRTATAPRWLKAGLRVNYRVQSATVVQRGENDGAGGAGYVQYDVVALDAKTAAVSSRFVLDSGDGQLVPNMVGRNLGVPGAGEFWLNPSVLPGARSVANDELGVYRTTQRIEGKTYQVTRFEYKTEDAEYVWVFENATGMLLFYRHALGKETDKQRQLSQMWYVSQRQLNLPWRAASAPAWAARGARLNYKGNTIITVAGGSKTSLLTTVAARILTREKGWTEWQMDTTVQLQVPSSSLRVSGIAQLYDALWLPAEALAELRNGQTLDTDALTGVEVTVARTQRTVTLRETGRGYVTSFTYDAQDGMLTAILRESQVGLAVTQIDLKLTSKP